MSRYKNEEKYTKALKDYQQDESITLTSLAEKYNFDRASFGRYLKVRDIPIRSYVRSRELIDKYDKATDLYKKGHSLYEIDDMIGLSKKSFAAHLRKSGIKIRHGFKRDGYDVNEKYFSNIDSPNKAYWLGFIFSDGCVVSEGRTYKIAIELNEIDESHLEKFKKALKTDIPIANRKDRNLSSITVCRKVMVDDLISYGCVPNKTIHGTLDLSDIEGFEKDFLRGYFDGDGYIEKDYTKYRLILTVKSEEMTNHLCELISDFNPRIQDCETYYRIHIERKENFFNLLDYLYEDAETYLNRKYYTYLDRKENMPS